MEIIELKWFQRRRDELFDDDQYRAFQMHLVLHPASGDVIPGGSGLRKIRWTSSRVGENAAAFG